MKDNYAFISLWMIGLLGSAWVSAQAPLSDQQAADEAERQRIREQQRIEARQRQQAPPSVLFDAPNTLPESEIPEQETPCVVINDIQLIGDDAEDFQSLLLPLTHHTAPRVAVYPRQASSFKSLRSAVAHDALPVLGRCLGTTGIDAVLKRLQNQLIDQGYVTSRIVVGEQDLNSGVLVLTLVPGRIGDIHFTDDRHFDNVLPMRAGELLNLRDIEQALESMQNLPSVTADIEIVPATGEDAIYGESDLRIQWDETASAVRLMLNADNSGTQSTGPYQGSLSLAVDNPLGLHDQLNLSLGHDLGGETTPAGGTASQGIDYRIPFGYWTVALQLNRSRHFQMVKGYRLHYRYHGVSRGGQLSLSRALYRDSVRTLEAQWAAWYRMSRNFRDGHEFTFQHRRTGGFEFTLKHREFIRNAIVKTQLSWRRGTGIFNAQEAVEHQHGEGSSRFSLLKAEVELSLPFTVGNQHFHYTGSWRRQHNMDQRLLAQNQFSIGGQYTVRGFDGEKSLTAERGWVLRNDLAWFMDARRQHSLYLGLDYGQVGGVSRRSLPGRSLVGAVVGVKGQYRDMTYDLSSGQPVSQPDAFPSRHWVNQFRVGLVF